MRPARASTRSKPKAALLEVAPGPRSPDKHPFPIVCIGASAGGLEAFTQLLGLIPPKSGMAFVLVQHLAPKNESALTEILSRATHIPVTEVEEGMAVEPDRVYVIPPNVNMGILNGRLHLIPRAPAQQHLPINFFLSSLAKELGSKAIGVILSGTASDGTLGMEAIKAEGGMTFAQDPKSAKFTDMPSNAIAAGCIDFVLTPAAIARELIRFASHPTVRRPPQQEEPAIEGESDLRKIFVLLRMATGVDFTHYKRSTILRGIKRRMALHKATTMGDYVSLLQQSRPELDALYQGMLIPVTSFFREPGAFEALKKHIFPHVLKNRASGKAIRIWVPGCSSGEEAYSIAICLREFLGNAGRSTDIQIFATDINEPILNKARAGVYPDKITADVSPERLRRFFVKTTRGYQIDKAIRDLCVFARQDIGKDPPFSRVDLISCRNLLIYLAAALQKRVIPIFHYALKDAGYLLLGNSESLAGFSNYFSPVDKKHNIYAKKLMAVRPAIGFPPDDFLLERKGKEEKPQETGSSFDIQKEVDRILLSRYSPAGVVINENLEILQFRGRTGEFLDPAPGQASLSLLKMAREGLALDLRAAIQEARNRNTPVRKQGIRTKRSGRAMEINIEVIPIKGPSSVERCFLVLFEAASPPAADTAKASRRPSARPTSDPTSLEGQVEQLTKELEQTRSSLQSIIEEHETFNEELKSANEEVLSSNEELQSTNEELETAKEELQSSNEELTTLNEELQNRNSELSVASNDLLNLLASVNIPVLILGHDLRLRHITPPAEKLLNLIPTDLGRPVTDINSNLLFAQWGRTIAEAIDSVSVKEVEMQDTQGHWYSMRIRPYRTSDNKIDGAVVSWIDINTLKAQLAGAETALTVVEERYHSFAERNLAGVFRAALDGRFMECNSAFAKIFGFEAPAQVLALKVNDLYGSGTDMNAFLARFENGTGPVSFEILTPRKDGPSRWVLTNAAVVREAGAAEAEIQGIVLDVTPPRETEESLRGLPIHLIKLQDAERKRLSLDLHDSTGSSLTALLANMTVIERSAKTLDKKARKALNESLNIARQCAGEIRTLAYLLHPPLLDDLGLDSALRWYVDGFSERTAVIVDLDTPPGMGHLPQEMELTIFRVVQEALTNVQRHSGSPTASVRIILAGSEVSVEITDVGKGVPGISRPHTHGQSGGVRPGLGISGMRERVSQLGGRLEIYSGEKGTTVKAVMPVHETKAAPEAPPGPV